MAKEVAIPAAIRRKMANALERKETSHEESFINWVREQGYLQRKINGAGHRFWPDRLVIVPDGTHFYFEFKRNKKDLTDAQAELHVKMHKFRCNVFKVYTKDEAIKILNNYGWG